MCGRFSLADLSALKKVFKINLSEGIKPRYNIAPSQDILIIINDKGYLAVNFRWGLIPFWSKDIIPGIINARAETIGKKPNFKHGFKNKRCLIPADGFYEWKGKAGRKRPYRIALKNRSVFTFAGLRDRWRSPKDEIINSCVIIITSANTLLKPIHSRMPVILSEKAEEAWLNEDADILTLKGLLNPYSAESMESYKISAMVNDYQNDFPEILKPV